MAAAALATAAAADGTPTELAVLADAREMTSAAAERTADDGQPTVEPAVEPTAAVVVSESCPSSWESPVGSITWEEGASEAGKKTAAPGPERPSILLADVVEWEKRHGDGGTNCCTVATGL